MKAAAQLTREQLTDAEYERLSKVFAFIRRVKLRERVKRTTGGE